MISNSTKGKLVGIIFALVCLCLAFDYYNHATFEGVQKNDEVKAGISDLYKDPYTTPISMP